MEKKRKTYTKPIVEGVYLLPDEAVLGDCKTDSSAGPGGTDKCGVDPGCSTTGS